MSVMKKLEESGLDVELEVILDKFVKNEGDEATVNELKSSIDETGLKSPKTMKAVGTLQKNGKLEPGLYKELVALNKRFEAGETVSTETEEETTSEPSVEESTGGESMSSEETNETPAAEEPTADNVVNLGNEHLSEKEEEKIKERMKKEEEKMRQRLLAREAKMRERLKARAEKRAQRQGMKLETLQAIKEKKEELGKLRETAKELREQMKKIRDEIKELRPKRKKKKEPKDGEGKGKAAAKKSA